MQLTLSKSQGEGRTSYQKQGLEVIVIEPWHDWGSCLERLVDVKVGSVDRAEIRYLLYSANTLQTKCSHLEPYGADSSVWRRDACALMD